MKKVKQEDNATLSNHFFPLIPLSFIFSDVFLISDNAIVEMVTTRTSGGVVAIVVPNKLRRP